MVSMPSPPVVDFLDQDYHYKSVSTQIPHCAGLVLIHKMGIEPWAAACEAVTLPLHHSCGHIHTKLIYLVTFLGSHFPIISL